MQLRFDASLHIRNTFILMVLITKISNAPNTPKTEPFFLHQSQFIMKKVFTLLFAFMMLSFFAQAQNPIQTPPASKKAAVIEYIGLTKVAVNYHRPGVKDREVYGEKGLVPYSAQIPWRAGANDNTTIYFADDVTINGSALPAGKYGFHIIPTENEWTLIFSKNNHAWGSYFYDEKEDALRVNVKPEACEHTEWLSYDFVNQTSSSADVRLRWEKKQISFTVGVDVYAVTMAGIEKDLENLGGFNPLAYSQAAQYCLSNDKDMDKALVWSERALDRNFGGKRDFSTLSTHAQVLNKMGKTAEAQAAMDEALPMGSISELHFYARSLIQNGDAKGAMKVFQMNRERHPDDKFTTVVGLARGHMALEEYKSAAKYFHEAAANAPDGQAGFYSNLAEQCEAKM